MHGFDEATGYGQSQACAGAYLVSLLRPVELVKDALEITFGNPSAFIGNLQVNALLVTPAPETDRGVSRRIFGGIVQQVEQHLLEQNGIHTDRGQVGAQLHLETVPVKDLTGALKRAADDLTDVVQRGVGNDRAGFELGHVK